MPEAAARAEPMADMVRGGQADRQEITPGAAAQLLALDQITRELDRQMIQHGRSAQLARKGG